MIKRCETGKCWPDLPDGPTEPYMLWSGVVIESYNKLKNHAYTDSSFQMCMCDTSTDCQTPANWHDLGPLNVEPASVWYMAEVRSVGNGGDLYTTVTLEDVPNPHVLVQYCMQLCDKMDECLGFETMHGNKLCYLRGEGVRVRTVPNNILGSVWYRKLSSARTEHFWYSVPLPACPLSPDCCPKPSSRTPRLPLSRGRGCSFCLQSSLFIFCCSSDADAGSRG